MNKAELGFETQRRRHQKSKTGVPVAPKKDMCPPKTLKKKKKKFWGIGLNLTDKNVLEERCWTSCGAMCELLTKLRFELRDHQ